MQPNTHLAIDPKLCGEVIRLAPNQAEVELQTHASMAADERGLVHGGFLFGAADYAAMLAVNHPNVVLGSARVQFTAPTRAGERVRFKAVVTSEKGRKREVEVEGRPVTSGESSDPAEPCFLGSFTCVVLDRHVLDPL
jgi:acyl-coenzyme A thioesterase PaaI-like protein